MRSLRAPAASGLRCSPWRSRSPPSSQRGPALRPRDRLPSSPTPRAAWQPATCRYADPRGPRRPAGARRLARRASRADARSPRARSRPSSARLRTTLDGLTDAVFLLGDEHDPLRERRRGPAVPHARQAAGARPPSAEPGCPSPSRRRSRPASPARSRARSSSTRTRAARPTACSSCRWTAEGRSRSSRTSPSWRGSTACAATSWPTRATNSRRPSPASSFSPSPPRTRRPTATSRWR